MVKLKSSVTNVQWHAAYFTASIENQVTKMSSRKNKKHFLLNIQSSKFGI